jgi:hypothetical protein
VGTSTGNYDVINGVDTFTTGQKGATEVVVTGLSSGTTYYCSASAVDAFGNEGALATEQTFVAATPSTPSRSYTDISSTTTISSSGDYRLTASFAGKITISADDVYLYGNGKTITFPNSNAFEPAILITGARDNIEIDSVSFIDSGDYTSLTVLGNILSDTTMSNSKIHGCTFQSRTEHVSGIVMGDSSGTRIYSNSITVNTGATTGNDRNACLIRNGALFKSFNNTITTQNSGRDGGYANSSNCEIFADTFTSLDNDEYTFISGYGRANCYVHDNTIDMSAQSQGRAIHCDGGNVAHGDGDWVILHNTITMGSGGYGISTRGLTDDNLYGYNTITGNGTGSPNGLRVGGAEGGAVPIDTYVYNNSATNLNGRGMIFYNGWTGNHESWSNTIDGIVLSGTPGGQWNSNNDSISGSITTIAGLGPWDWNNGPSLAQCTGTTAHITEYTDTWQGFNGNNDTPAAPTNIQAVS